MCRALSIRSQLFGGSAHSCFGSLPLLWKGVIIADIAAVCKGKGIKSHGGKTLKDRWDDCMINISVDVCLAKDNIGTQRTFLFPSRITWIGELRRKIRPFFCA